MILSTFSVLFAFGFAVWLVGDLFGYPAVSIIGAVIVIVAGSGVAMTGLEYQSGETVTNTTSGQTVEFQYQETALQSIWGPTWLAELGLGGLVMVLGTVALSRTLDSFR